MKRILIKRIFQFFLLHYLRDAAQGLFLDLFRSMCFKMTFSFITKEPCEGLRLRAKADQARALLVELWKLAAQHDDEYETNILDDLRCGIRDYFDDEFNDKEYDDQYATVCKKLQEMFKQDYGFDPSA